jgi:hypothetical protein
MSILCKQTLSWQFTTAFNVYSCCVCCAALSPAGLKKLDKSAVQAALRDGADPNMTNSAGDTARGAALAGSWHTVVMRKNIPFAMAHVGCT